MLPDAILDGWGASPSFQPAYLLYHQLLTNARRGAPLEGRVVRGQLGWTVEVFRPWADLLVCAGLYRPSTRTVTIVGDPFIERAVQCASLVYVDGVWEGPRGPVHHTAWLVGRTQGSGQFGEQPFGYSPNRTEAEAWAVLEGDRAFWRGWGVEFPVVKKGRAYTPATDPLRPQVESVQQYANRRFGKSVQLLDAQGKEVGRGSGLGRYGVIRRALADWGYSVEQLQTVIDRAADDEWWRSKGLLDTLRIFRKPEHAERWLNVGAGPRTLLSVGGASDAEAF